MKDKLIQYIKYFINLLFFPLSKRIVFESNPEFTGNVGAVYTELLRRGINKKYKLVWRVEDKEKYRDYGSPNVSFIDYEPKSFKEKLRWFWYRWSSKMLIFENKMSEKKWHNQMAINLMHGMPIKANRDYVAHDTCDFIVSSGEKLNGILSREMDIPIKRFVTLGYPRTDALGKATGSLEKLGIRGFDKVIVWMPTYRKHATWSTHFHEGAQFPSGVPLLTEKEHFEALNEKLKAKNTLLIIKLHPVQDMSGISETALSDILLLSDKTMREKGCSVYELLAESDALLTDYSSVYYDYLLCDKPIGLVIDDIGEYTANRGLAFEYKDYIKGDYIYTLDELIAFASDVSDGTDPAEGERLWAKAQWCDFTDFKSTERVADFILDKLNWRKS